MRSIDPRLRVNVSKHSGSVSNEIAHLILHLHSFIASLASSNECVLVPRTPPEFATLLDGAPFRADTPQSAWERAIVIAFRACQSSGALPMTITINAPARRRPGSNLVVDRAGDLIFKSE